jgi:uncharacterized protein (TIGR00725 family)
MLSGLFWIKNMKKLIAVFGPANCTPGDELYDAAERLGGGLAHAGFIVVTGGYGGVMEAASKGARNAGGSTVGITAEVYFAKGREANEFITREIKVKSASDRLMELLDLPDAWIAIGQSSGTLVEVATAWDYMVKWHLPMKPLLLVGESWREFLKYLDGHSKTESLMESCLTVELALERLKEIFGEQQSLPDLEVIQ